MSIPPENLADTQLVCWSAIDGRHRPTGATRHLVGWQSPLAPAGIAIGEDPDSGGFFLYQCDADWRVLTDTWHEDLASARRQAELEFAGVTATWQPARSPRS
jgi:hypothetical protein